MLRRPFLPRAGFSLVEVLVAVFIVSAGLIALLTLFPLGAVQMGQALRDDRSQQCALQADGKIRELWRSRVIEQTAPNDEFYQTLDDADGALATYTALPADRRASYPVLFDPFGYASYTINKQRRVAQPSGAFFPRRTTTPVPALPALAYRSAMLQDDMEFAGDGTPADAEGVAMPASGSQRIFRAGRYNYAAVIQRPDNSNRLVADLKILVFDRRAPGVDPIDNELAFGAYSLPNGVAPNTLAVGDTQLRIALSNDTLGLRVGSWLMDGTITNGGVRNANFYRVTSLDDSVVNEVTVELHIPIVKARGDVNPTAPYACTIYLFRELIDVYDRPQLAPSGYQKQTP